MRKQSLFVLAVFAAVSFGSQARGDFVTSFEFSGAGVSGSGTFTYGTDPISGDPSNAFAITGISGTFSDSNNGLNIVDATITGLVAVSPTYQAPPFPASLSYYPASGLPMDSALSYDNLFYPDGSSPDVCPGYNGAGGYLDIFGVLFTLSNGDVVDVWSNGTWPGGPPLSYGVAVVGLVNGTSTAVDYVSDGVLFSVPEPTSIYMLVSGLVGVVAIWRRRLAPFCIRL